MSYIGRDIRTGAFRQLDDISSGFDGSDTTHTMQVNSTNVSVGDVNQILLSLGGVIQKPGTDFTVSGSTLTFTTAPAANTSFFAILLGSDNGGTVTPTDGSVTTGKIVDDAVTAAKVASSGAFAIGASGTASSLAGITFYQGQSGSIYTADVSGTDNDAENNTAFGTAAMDAITTGDNNVAMGEAALGALTTGADNVAIGYNAGSAGTSASYNTMVGRNAGAATTASSAITAIGYYAGAANTSATQNTFLGFNAGAGCTDGGYNTAIGHNALRQPDSETNNVAIGRLALEGAIAGGEYNVAVGNNTLDALTSGDGNTAIGYNTCSALTTGDHNVAVGFECIQGGVTTGDKNIGIGYRAGYNLTSAGNSTFVGHVAGYACTTQSNSTAIGVYAGYNLSTGDGGNSLLGYAAGYAITSGVNNTCLGYDSGRTGSPGGNITTGSHNIVLGDDRVLTLNAQVSLSVASDKRDKTDVSDLDLGLDFINKLKPVTFRWDKRIKYVSDADRDTVDLNSITNDGTHKEDWLDVGFLAQDLQTAEESYNYKIANKTNLTVSLSHDEKQYLAKYEKLVPMLVKAVQELSTKVKALEEA